ncbi:MAG: copper resistance protein B [Rhodanobacteraceae bacterium]
MNARKHFIVNASRLLVGFFAATLALPAFAQDGMQGSDVAPMSGTDHGAKQPSKPVELKRLDDGQMIGMRPVTHGLAAGGMNMSSMQGMNMDAMMKSMQGGSAPPNARSPDCSDGYRYTSMPGMHMPDDAPYGMLLLDQVEYADGNYGHLIFIDGEAYYGTDLNKLWVKSEGEHSGGKLQDLRTEALWDHAFATYFSTQLGVRRDFGQGPDRNWAAFGVQGLARYWFETEAFVYVGDSGRTAARLQAEYEESITQRLILQPKIEVNLYGRDDPQRGVGSGLSDAEFGLRLRYEIRREFAPYIGIVWRQRYGRTADFARTQDEHANDLQFVAGLHVWF